MKKYLSGFGQDFNQNGSGLPPGKPAFIFPVRIVLLCLLVFFYGFQALGYERVIVLNTAVTPILKEMNLGSVVVGVTYNDDVLKGVTRIGSHLSPNIELIKALRPDLIIAGSKRAFPDKLKKRFDAELFRYDPRNLDEILESVLILGRMFHNEDQADRIVGKAKATLSRLRQPVKPVGVVFEISHRPLKVAGAQNIVSSVIKAAGGNNLVSVNKKHVLLSPEKVLELKPDIYIFQNGPMNKNPLHPSERSYYRSMQSKVVEVDQLLFTRAGLNAFQAVQDLNRLFNGYSD